VNRPFSCRRAEDQRIKVTPGITGLSPPIVHIDGEVWHLKSGCRASDCHSFVRSIRLNNITLFSLVERQGEPAQNGERHIYECGQRRGRPRVTWCESTLRDLHGGIP
jgi:hypothetical protein